MDNPTTPPLIGNENDPPDAAADHPYPTDESPGIDANVSSDKEEYSIIPITRTKIESPCSNTSS